MMNTSLYGTYIEKAGDNIEYDMTIEYYLLEQELVENQKELSRYGVAVKKTAVYPNGEKKSNTAEVITDIFCRIEDVKRFLDILITGRVTPMTFREITEEFVLSRFNFSVLESKL